MKFCVSYMFRFSPIRLISQWKQSRVWPWTYALWLGRNAFVSLLASVVAQCMDINYELLLISTAYGELAGQATQIFVEILKYQRGQDGATQRIITESTRVSQLSMHFLPCPYRLVHVHTSMFPNVLCLFMRACIHTHTCLPLCFIPPSLCCVNTIPRPHQFQTL